MKKNIEKKKYYRSWTLSDELWERVKDEIPKRQRDENKTYKNKPGQGRKPIPPRKVLEGILYVLRTGCQWKAVPKQGNRMKKSLKFVKNNTCQKIIIKRTAKSFRFQTKF